MNLATPVRPLSLGHALDADRTACGVIHSVFSHAVNVAIDGDLWTLLAAGKGDMPFGIRVPVRDFDALGLQRGDAVHVRSGIVSIGPRLSINCRGARKWSPAREGEISLGLMQRLAVVAKAARAKSWSVSPSLARALKSAMYTPATLGPVLSRVVGCGLGATPSGDDVLVGILAVLHSRCAAEAGARDAALIRSALLPLLSKTTDISAYLLRQAASGLVGRDLHELVCALVAENYSGELSDKLRRVIETGATSGADMCEGLLAFAPSYFTQQSQRAAA